MPSQVLSVNILREDTIRKKYPASYEDCGTNDDEQCPKGYPGAQVGTDEYNEVMKFTSAVKMFGKRAQEKRSKSLDTKTEAATGGQQEGEKCPEGHYAETTAPKPSKAVPDIILKSKTTGKLLGTYNCKGEASMYTAPPYNPPPPDHCGCNPCARVPTVWFK